MCDLRNTIAGNRAGCLATEIGFSVTISFPSFWKNFLLFPSKIIIDDTVGRGLEVIEFEWLDTCYFRR